uniref:Uncharacterized protein n=1 Tax=Panagrolaimus sp. PS1159 TaxID=55785 RepID=A0AC35G9K2_9BILA
MYTPRLLFPALVMCPTGLLSTKHNIVGYIAFWLFLTFFGCSTVAVLSAFLYRYIALKSKLRKFLSPKWLIILGILHVTYELPTIILYALGISNRNEIDKAVLMQRPNIAPYYNGIGCASIHFDVTPFPFLFMLSCIAAFTLGVPIVVTLVLKSFSTLKKQRNLMSPKTYKMHHQLLTTLIFQLLVPITTLFGPFIVNSLLVMAGAENIAWLMQSAFVLGTLHSSFNTLMMFYFIQPYRQAFLRLLKIKNISSIAAITAIDFSRTDPMLRMTNLNLSPITIKYNK